LRELSRCRLAGRVDIAARGFARFAEKHAGVIDFASDALDFRATIRAAVSKDSPAAVERRLEVARRYDWSALMERLSDPDGSAADGAMTLEWSCQ